MVESVQQKSERLLAEGRIIPDAGPGPRVFTAIGDTATYWPVVVSATRRFCPCEYGRHGEGDCSHLTAAVTYVLAEGLRAQGKDSEQIEAFEAALAERKAWDAAKAGGLGVVR